jgi:hypothetical protein
MILISQEIPPFSLFLFPFWEFFSLSFYTPTTMITGPRAAPAVMRLVSIGGSGGFPHKEIDRVRSIMF